MTLIPAMYIYMALPLLSVHANIILSRNYKYSAARGRKGTFIPNENDRLTLGNKFPQYIFDGAQANRWKERSVRLRIWEKVMAPADRSAEELIPRRAIMAALIQLASARVTRPLYRIIGFLSRYRSSTRGCLNHDGKIRREMVRRFYSPRPTFLHFCGTKE